MVQFFTYPRRGTYSLPLWFLSSLNISKIIHASPFCGRVWNRLYDITRYNFDVFIYIYIKYAGYPGDEKCAKIARFRRKYIYIQKKKKKRNSLNRVWKKYWNTYWIFKVNITLFKIIRSFRSRIPKPFILSPLFNFFF